MLDALKFVQRGVARRDFVPGLTHFRIQNGRVTGFNGQYSLSAPVDISFDFAPNAGLFIKALDACEDVITLSPEGKNVLVRSGTFKTVVPCIPLEDVPTTFPAGVNIAPHESVLSALQELQPFVGIDASRPWSTGILLADQSAWATNNVVIAEYWLGTPFAHTVNIPSGVIDEVIKVGEELVALQIDGGGSITFHYADTRWIKAQLLALDWPDIQTLMTQVWDSSSMAPVTHGLEAALEKLSRFVDKKDARVFFRGMDVATKREGAVAGGAVVDLPGLPTEGCYNINFLRSVLEVASRVDFSRYPLPVPFMGDRIRGALVGIREDI